MNFLNELEDIESAEDVFAFFGVPYDADRLMVVRLHVLARFREYMGQINSCHKREPEEKIRGWLKEALARAYEDFDEGMTPENRKYLFGKEPKSCSCAGKCGQIQAGEIKLGDF